jgi:hypothetical protein
MPLASTAMPTGSTNMPPDATIVWAPVARSTWITPPLPPQQAASAT